MSPAQLEKLGDNFGSNPVCVGPFMFDHQLAGDHITVIKSPYYYDQKNGISAMERSTGYSLSITGQMQARGEIGKSGVFTPDEAIPPEKYISELAKRGVMIKEMK